MYLDPLCWRVMLCILFIPASIASSKVKLSPALSWWNARANCKSEYNGDLYMSTSRPGLQFPKLDPDMFYWVGALEASEWIWTDNSSPFKHIGYVPTDALWRQVSNRSISGNSLALCYRDCYSEPYFGLSKARNTNVALYCGAIGGTKVKFGEAFHPNITACEFGENNRCYCLSNNTVSTMVSVHEDEHSCPGHVREKCGDSNGVSIYETDINFGDNREGQCVLAYFVMKQILRDNVFFEKTRTANCTEEHYAVCSDKLRDGNFSCTSDTYSRCSEGVCVTCDKLAWHIARKTCNLVKVTNKNKDQVLHPLKKVLKYWIGLHKVSRKMWIDGKDIETDYGHVGNMTPVCLALLYRNDTRWIPKWIPCSENHPAICTKHTFPTGLYTGSELYIGSGFGVVLLVCLLVVVIAVLKKKKVCFEKQQGTVGRADNQQRAIAKGADFHECIENRKSEGFGDEDNYSRADPITGSEVAENCYGHLRVGEENDYDIAGRKPDIDNWDSTYNHIDVIRTDKESEEVDNAYINSKADGDNDYDIVAIGGKPERDQVDSTYNHLDAIQGDN